MAVRVSTGYAEKLMGANAFDQIFRDGAMFVYSGAQPATADDPVSGTLLARITLNGGAWAAGSPTNGLRFVRSGRFAMNDPSQEWALMGIDTGIAGWVRLVGNAADPGNLSLTLPRIDAAIGLTDGSPGDYQMRLPSIDIVPAMTIPISSWWYENPIN